MTAAPPTDADIIVALCSQHERFLIAASTEPLLVAGNSFLHCD
jgi:hypothetical protein